MGRMPEAEWRGPLPTSNYRPGGNTPIGLIVHHADGSLASADASFHNPARGASAHFGVDFDGHIVQWVDTGDVAYAQCMGNWQGWVSVENASDPNQPDAPPTAAQIASMGRIIKWLGTPAVPATSMTSGGVGYHRQFPGDCSVAWGQTACPGNGFIASIPAICAAAGGADPLPPTIGVDDMKVNLVRYAGDIGNVYALVPDREAKLGIRRKGPLTKVQQGALAKAGLVEFDGFAPKVYGPLDADQFTVFE